MMVHGKVGTISLAEETKARLLVDELYTRLASCAPPVKEWLLNAMLEQQQEDSYANIVAWIDSIKQVSVPYYTRLAASRFSY